MSQQLSEIGIRLAALRDAMDITAEKMAENLNIDINEYIDYEKGQRDFSFSFLQNAANIFGVDVVDIISGESPKLTACTLVRSGGGYAVNRREEYNYKHLAFSFSNKKADPLMVTVDPKTKRNGAIKLHSHEGQEFDYMVSGSMKFYLGDIIYELNEGDSVYFNANLPHAMKALDGQPAKFIAVVIK